MILLIILTLLLPFHESVILKKEIEKSVVNILFIHYYDSIIYEEDKIIIDRNNFISRMNNSISCITDIKDISEVMVSYYFDLLKVNIKLTFEYKSFYCLIAKEINMYEE